MDTSSSSRPAAGVEAPPDYQLWHHALTHLASCKPSVSDPEGALVAAIARGSVRTVEDSQALVPSGRATPDGRLRVGANGSLRIPGGGVYPTLLVSMADLRRLYPSRSGKPAGSNSRGAPRHRATDLLLVAAGSWLCEHGKPGPGGRAPLEKYLARVAENRGHEISESTVRTIAKEALVLYGHGLMGEDPAG